MLSQNLGQPCPQALPPQKAGTMTPPPRRRRRSTYLGPFQETQLAASSHRLASIDTDALHQRAMARLHERHLAWGYHYKWVAALLGIDAVHVRRIILADGWPSLSVLLKLTVAYDLPLWQLYLPAEPATDSKALAALLQTKPDLTQALHRLLHWSSEAQAQLSRMVTLLEDQPDLLTPLVHFLEALAAERAQPDGPPTPEASLSHGPLAIL
jgi:hypothetical protein